MDAERDEARLGSRAPHFIQASRPLHLVWKVGVFVVGLGVIGGGIILLPLPGPGWLVIFGGVALWGTEFVWAQRMLRWAKRKVTAAAHRAAAPEHRRRNIVLGALALAVVAALVAVYVWQFGAVLPWRIRG
ncbi:TIGR02611 family protein [Streptomyces fuscigenes]|uniref:TIGR02611 family protein n=1 Tax=Streptomyces fuscigenes TaxID=1528880 RepID=UPI001F3A0C42|nr:TIGR02611 family protein [Streptomyces fuscigenes]MCF3964355.1 TIGR02611 family protein [Streptomyces fuscigenes]